jgi:NAD(P)-dependent dehydrogenase (short-subunit alcohol dehydrogenase family)
MAFSLLERLQLPFLTGSAAGGVASGFLLMRSWLSGMTFSGKTVLITGGSRGLGLELAREFIRLQARVVICARDALEVERARVELARHGGEVLGVPCDITERAQVEEMLTLVEERFGPVEVLVNNAGIIHVGPMEAMTLDDYEQAMGTHFWAPLQLTLSVLPGMRERGKGHVINISSIGGRISIPHLLPYTASKYALVGLSRGLRAELSKYGVQVTTVTPGLMRTGSPPNASFTGDASAEYLWFILGDSIPVLSLRARRAARRILQSAALGRAEVSLFLVPWLAMTLYNLAPGVGSRLSSLVDRLLPHAPVGPPERRHGTELKLPRMVERLVVLTRRAALRNNEVPSAIT